MAINLEIKRYYRSHSTMLPDQFGDWCRAEDVIKVLQQFGLEDIIENPDVVNDDLPQDEPVKCNRCNGKGWVRGSDDSVRNDDMCPDCGPHPGVTPLRKTVRR